MEDLQKYAEAHNDAYCLEARKYASGVHWVNDSFDLTPDSKVVEVGGYLGEWAAYISDKYRCFIDIYEPVVEFYEHLVSRFHNNSKIRVFNQAVEAWDGVTNLDVKAEGTSLIPCTTGVNAPTAETIDVVRMMKQRNPVVDLLAINAEGSEYNILDRLISTGEIKRVKNLLVQFHTFYPHAEARRNLIRSLIKQTHREVLCYPFTWEIWTQL